MRGMPSERDLMRRKRNEKGEKEMRSILFTFAIRRGVIAAAFLFAIMEVCQASQAVFERNAERGVLIDAFGSEVAVEGALEGGSLTCSFPAADWRSFDRLVLRMVNRSDAGEVRISIGNEHGDLDKGLGWISRTPSFGYMDVVIPLCGWPRRMDVSRIARIRFEGSGLSELEFWSARLISATEDPPSMDAGWFEREVCPIIPYALAAAKRQLDERVALTEAFCEDPAVRSRRDALVAAERIRIRAPGRGIGEYADFERMCAELSEGSGHFQDFIGFLADCANNRAIRAGIAIGMATGMEHVRPRGRFKVRPAREFAFRLARGEWENAQVVVAAVDGDRKSVGVKVSDMIGADGEVLAATNVICSVTGYVKTWVPARYRTPVSFPTDSAPGYAQGSVATPIGWYPDPILDFMNTAPVARDDVQSFWIRVGCPRGQRAGMYRGRLTVVSDVGDVSFPLVVRVNDFDMPLVSPLPLAINFNPQTRKLDRTRAELESVAADPDSPCNAWKRHKFEWVDFLADHYITMDSIYRWREPDYEVLNRLRGQNRLGMFNLAYFEPAYLNGEHFRKWRQGISSRLRPGYEWAKTNNLLDHAFVYGCDELNTGVFERVEYAAAYIATNFPGAKTLTTARDQTYSLDSKLQHVDWFSPYVPWYDLERAERARAKGKRVWWYMCADSSPYYPNFIVEWQPIVSRLLMGVMPTRMRPDGFLYFESAIWCSRRCIESGPFTDWDPRVGWRVHGDGSLVCAGPDGTPLSTVRLQNFRDGLEDYAYAEILRDRLGSHSDKNDEWTKAALIELAVSESVFARVTNFNLDPAPLTAWRERVSDLIERSGRK